MGSQSIQAHLNPKPFACTWKDCKKEFTNEDHLNVHTKNHDLAINVGQNTPGGDQTPTPSSFIHNSEELCLFQDLQHVNPFDETFSQATECNQKGACASPEKTGDTLHAPQVFAHIKQELSNTKKAPITSITESGNINSHASSSKVNFKLRESQLNFVKFRNRLKKEREEKDGLLKQLELLRCDSGENISSSFINQNGNTKNVLHSTLNLDRQREMNRVAQTRSRAKKKYILDLLFEDLEKVKQSRNQLARENHFLKYHMTILKQILLLHNDCSATKDPIINQKIAQLKRGKVHPSQNQANTKGKLLKPILPNDEKNLNVPFSIPVITPQFWKNLATKRSFSAANSTPTGPSATPKLATQCFTYGAPIFIQVTKTCDGVHSTKKKQTNTELTAPASSTMEKDNVPKKIPKYSNNTSSDQME